MQDHGFCLNTENSWAHNRVTGGNGFATWGCFHLRQTGCAASETRRPEGLLCMEGEDEGAVGTKGATGGVAYGFSHVGVTDLLEVEILEDAIFFFLRGFGGDFYCGVCMVGFGIFVADYGAVGVGEDGVAVLGKLSVIAIIVTGGGHTGGVSLLSEHYGYVDRISFDLFNSVGWEDGKEE